MNPSCPAKIRESLFHWGCRDALDIEGLGRKLSEQLVDRGLVKDVSDLYRLTVQQLASLDRMGAISAKNLISELDKSRGTNLQRFITGLGIPGIGRTVSGLLADRFSDLNKIMDAGFDDFLSIEGIGPVLADNLQRFFSEKVTRDVVKRLLNAGFSPESSDTGYLEKPLQGLTLVFTGGISTPRPDARKMAEDAGAKVTGSVSSKTDLIVAGPGAGSKLRKAREMGIEIVDESEFLRRINRDGG
jgi:DNA ligase (NAD+)